MNRTQDLLEKLKNKYGESSPLHEIIEKENIAVSESKAKEKEAIKSVIDKFSGKFYMTSSDEEGIFGKGRKFYHITDVEHNNKFNTDFTPIFDIFGEVVMFDEFNGVTVRNLSTKCVDNFSEEGFDYLVEISKEKFDKIKGTAEVLNKAIMRIIDDVNTVVTISGKPIISK